MANKIREYEGQDIVVRYDVRRCIHAAECVRGLPQVFNTKARPWVQPDAATPDQVAAVVMRCPTGALHFERKDGGPDEPVPDANAVTVAANGPLHVRGSIEIVAPDGTVILEDTRVSLCRCGASGNKPFCDNRHLEIGFAAAGALGESGLRTDEPDSDDQNLQIVPSANGPLLVSGRVELRGGDGQISLRGNRAALCRCGASGNKPFCDGSHRRVGFQANAE
jgi:CDGSH-type Zn-finger protein/uncharacterized Fe-S cluster protein YjdI